MFDENQEDKKAYWLYDTAWAPDPSINLDRLEYGTLRLFGNRNVGLYQFCNLELEIPGTLSSDSSVDVKRVVVRSWADGGAGGGEAKRILDAVESAVQVQLVVGNSPGPTVPLVRSEKNIVLEEVPEEAPSYSDARIYEVALEPALEVPCRQSFAARLVIPDHVQAMLKAFDELRGRSLFQVCLGCVRRRPPLSSQGGDAGSEEDDGPIFG